MKIATLAALPATLLLIGLNGTAAAQEVIPCATDEMHQRLIQENPDLPRLEAEYELGLQEYLQAKAGLRDDGEQAVYVLPIVFHVLYDPSSGSDSHNVSNQQIFNVVDRLNRDYRNRNADTVNIVDPFKPVIGDMRIEFRLATKDPFGNCTNGIDRITSLRSGEAADFSKLNPWFREHYVNVWVIRALEQTTPGQTTLGYAYFPSGVQDEVGSLRDGVIMLSSALNGTTLTHELGHYLNLQHPWGNGPVGVACGDDGVEDTPITHGHFSYCDLNDHDCNNWVMDEAYTFSQVTTTSGTQDPTPPPAGLYQDSLPGVSFSPFQAHGVSDNPVSNGRFGFNGWDLGAQDTDSLYSELTGSINMAKYYDVTVVPTFGKAMSITGLKFNAGRSSTGPRTFAVRASIGNYNANLAASYNDPDSVVVVHGSNVFFFKEDQTAVATGTRVTVPNLQWNQNNTFKHIRTPVTFRIYAWNAEDEEGEFHVDDVQVIGSFGEVANSQNYMDYSNCAAMIFTKGQGERMRAVLENDVAYRNRLWTAANHQFTGIEGYEVDCAPEADFYTLSPFVCEGTSVQFKENSKRATPTSWEWTFQGGTPATSTAQNPTVSFSEPGIHEVSLTVSNEHGSHTYTKWNAVYVGGNYSEVETPLQEPFNSQSDFNRWPTQNLENNESFWQWDGSVGRDAPGCAKLNASQTYTLTQDFFVPNNFKDIDALLTPMLAMPFQQDLTVSFWYAYSTQGGDTEELTETLKVYASSDCGKNWLLRKTLNANELITAGIRSPGYKPAEDEWREATFTLPTLFAGGGVRLKFEYTSSLTANDLFIDDIQVHSSNVGIDEHATAGGMILMPNPANDQLTIQMDLAGARTATITMMDITGRVLYTKGLNAGQSELRLDLARMGLSAGTYLVRLNSEQGQHTERLVVH